jgi:hypothetical protein
MKKCLYCLVVVPFLVTCAETATTADNEAKCEKVTRTGSNLPTRDCSSAGVITLDKDAAGQVFRGPPGKSGGG